MVLLTQLKPLLKLPKIFLPLSAFMEHSITCSFPQKGLVYILYTLLPQCLANANQKCVVCINYLYDNLNIYIFVYMQEYTFSFDHSYFWDTKTVSMQSII